MNKGQKKEVFLCLLSNLFSDNTDEINEVNSIEFYHFLIDSLENEASEISHKNEFDDFVLCRELIHMLCNFDIMFVDYRTTNAIATDRKKLIKVLVETTGLSEFDLVNSLSNFRKIYIFIKDGFLLSSY